MPPQVAYAVGRRVGGAVRRNRLRRRLRAAVFDLAPDMPTGAYLVSAGAEANGLSFRDLRSSLGRCIEALRPEAASVGRKPRSDR